MTRLLPPPLALYLHFPWCVRKCPYCDFNSYTLRHELPADRYIDALERDLAFQVETLLCGPGQGREVRPVVSIFLGGGTPSLFPPEAIGRLLEAVRRYVSVAGDVEVTLEANPGTLERGRFAEYRAAGVNRVSLGAQSFDPARLQALGRIHTPRDTCRAAEELHAAGLANFNLDLMYGLPDQDVAGAVRDVEQALALSPAHISHYQLTIEPGTVFAAAPPALPDDDSTAAMLQACRERLAGAGFAQYEVSAYALSGRQCRHNLNYWCFGDYLGVGAGAHGKLTFAASGVIRRTVRQREPRRYLAASPQGLAEHAIPAQELPFEFMLNALRLVDGFPIAMFEERTGLAWETVGGTVALLAGRGLLELDGGRCRPTPLGLRFLNEALLEFIPESPESPGPREMSTALRGHFGASPTALYTGPGSDIGK